MGRVPNLLARSAARISAVVQGLLASRLWPVHAVTVATILAFSFPLLFVANSDWRMTGAAFPDSGEIVMNIIQLLPRELFYNQTHLSHAGIYGWTYNSTVFWLFALLKYMVHLDPDAYFAYYAITSRGVSLAYSIGAVLAFAVFAAKFTTNRLYIAASVLALIWTQPFHLFSFQIHSDNAGVMFCILSALNMLAFLERGERRSLVLTTLFWCLASLAKQYWGLLLIPLGMTYVAAVRRHTGCTIPRVFLAARFVPDWLASLGAALLAAFLVHPYAFLRPRAFLYTQTWLKNSGFANQSVGEGAWHWVTRMLPGDLLLLAGLTCALVTCIQWALGARRQAPDGTGSDTPVDSLRRILALYCVLHVAWVVQGIRWVPLQHYHYLLPVYPFLIVLVLHAGSAIGEKVKGMRKPAFTVLAGGVALAVIGLLFVERVTWAVWQVSTYARFYSSNEHYARVVLEGFGPQPSRLLYSTSLPVPPNLYTAYVNDWAFGNTKDPKFMGLVRSWKPDVMIIDEIWALAEGPVYAKVAHELGLTHKRSFYAIYPSYNDPECNVGKPAPLGKMIYCMKRNLRMVAPPAAWPKDRVAFSIYSREPLAASGATNAGK